MQGGGRGGVFGGGMGDRVKEGAVGVFKRRRRCLDNHGRGEFLRAGDDRLDHLQVLGVERAHGVIVFCGFAEHFFCCHVGHKIYFPFLKIYINNYLILFDQSVIIKLHNLGSDFLRTGKTRSKIITLTLYHGSDKTKTIEDLKFPGPRINCDFGPGFYLAESKETAEEWVRRNETPVINVYSLTFDTKESIERKRQQRESI